MRNFNHPINMLFAAMLVFATLFIGEAFAQDAEEKSTLTKFVEGKLSSPNRQISLNGLQGSLSSNVSLTSITIADEAGVWLTIEKPELVWNRSALLRGRLEIESLTAESVNYPRNAQADESAPSPEVTTFALPELPVAIVVEKLSIPSVRFGPTVFGLEAEAGIDGKIVLDDGNLDVNLAVVRKDGPGGEFTAIANYVSESGNLKLDVKLSEPPNGIVANLLNLQDRPPVSLTITGDAPVSDLTVNLGLEVAQKPVVSGTLAVKKEQLGNVIRLDLGGPLATILPPDTRDFFGNESRIRAKVTLADDGTKSIDSLSVKSGAVDLTAEAKLLADGFLQAAKINGNISPQTGERVILPANDGKISIASAKLDVDYDATKDNAWNATVDLDEFQQPDLEIAAIDFVANGKLRNLNSPENRGSDFQLDGKLAGFNASDKALNEAVGDTITLKGGGDWQTNQPVQLQRFAVKGETFDLSSNGQFADGAFDGTIELVASRLAAFSSLAQRQLSGRARLRTDGKIYPASGTLDLRISGTTTNLGIGDETVDPLLDGETVLQGGLARDETGLTFDKFRLANDAFETTLNGRYATDRSDLEASAKLRDLADISKQASGTTELTAALKGEQAPFDLRLKLGIEDGTVSNRKVENLSVSFDGLSDLKSIRGKLASSGLLGSQPLQLAGYISADAKVQSLQQFVAAVGNGKVSGDFKRNEAGLIDADINIDAKDISAFAALALQEAKGSVTGAVKLTAENGKQSGTADVAINGVTYQDYSIGAAEIEATFADLFNSPSVDGIIKGENIKAAGVVVTNIDGTVNTQGDTTNFDLRAALDRNDVRIDTNGSVVQRPNEIAISLNRLNLDSNITAARLEAPTRLVVRNGTVSLTDTRLSVGSGSLVITGDAGNALNLRAQLNQIPLSIVNSIRPQTGAGGTLSGSVSVSGTTSQPDVTFDLSGSGLTAAQLSGAGISPLALTANGRFADNTVTLTSASARNAQNIDIAARGTVPLAGNGLSLNVDGTAPLALAQSQLDSRGASISGVARFQINVTGSLQNPQPSGLLSVQGGTLVDPLSNLKLTNIEVLAGISANAVTLNRASANLSGGGSVSATGSVAITGDMVANIQVRINNAKYTDGQFVSTSADGTLSLTGPLAFNPLLSGQINLGKTEITVPEALAKDGTVLDVRHVNPDAQVQRTLDRILKVTPKGRPTSRPSIMRLDLLINAPNQIFIRGRGLDAELGGSIRIRGNANDVRPSGRFELKRGRLSILGQRIDLTEGSITLTGDLDPLLRLVASTQAGEVEAFITLSGRISDLDVTFSSQPELPQDEVLALIIFGRGLSDLSPVQIARLASIAAELTGGNSPGLVDGIRRGTGLDDLDIVQDSDGNTAVKAGKYISDNVYLGVQAGAKSEATINLDVTDNVTVRGAVDTEGGSSIGVFLEKDY